jgi:hypothetical protein
MRGAVIPGRFVAGRGGEVCGVAARLGQAGVFRRRMRACGNRGSIEAAVRAAVKSGADASLQSDPAQPMAS